MKTSLPLALLLPIALGACHSSGPNAVEDAPASTGAARQAASAPAGAGLDELKDALPRYHWRLSQAQTKNGEKLDSLFVRQDKPLTLEFTDNQLSVRNLCNRMGGSYQLKNDTLQVGALNATMMACSEPGLMNLEKEAGRLLHGQLAAALTTAGDTPALTLTTAAGDTLTFDGQPTAQTRFGSQGEKVFLEIAPQRIACSHPLKREHKCLKVREISYNDNGTKASTGQWQPMYEDIEGYTFQPGIRSVLRLDKFVRKDPPADASSVAYVLDMIVESETVSP